MFFQSSGFILKYKRNLIAVDGKAKLCMKILEQKLTLQMHFIQKFEV
jgi:hypothetical protein